VSGDLMNNQILYNLEIPSHEILIEGEDDNSE
jgi:hypothetical protein